MDPVTAVGLAASAVQLAALAKCVIQQLVRYCSDVKNAPKMVAKLNQELETLSYLIEGFNEALMTSPKELIGTPDAFPNVINDIRSTLEEMNSKLIMSQKGVARRLIQWPFTKHELLQYLKDVDRYKTTFNAALNIQIA